MTPEMQFASLLRHEVLDLIAGTFFLFSGVVALLFAMMVHKKEARILIWIGLWSAMYGFVDLASSPIVTSAMPQRFELARQLSLVCCRVLMIVPATLAFRELTQGALRRFVQALLIINLTIALVAISWFLVSGSQNIFFFYNELFTIPGLVAVIVTSCVPKLSERYLLISRNWVLIAGAVIFSAEALCVNILRLLNYNVPRIYGTLGFAVLLLSFAYTALQMIDSNERRLLSIDNELAIARHLQFSILPGAAPEVPSLSITALYEPMTAVAGDFYDFLPIDDHRVGFLIADVSGHGVPAALFASMIKVAMQTVNNCASDPGEVLKRLRSVLNRNLRGQFVTAGYLWIDTEAGFARYSAAGHPPLILWRSLDDALYRIESNGLLFGMDLDSEYPVRQIRLEAGDRLLLYTDGITEAENGVGEQFGDGRLEQVMRDNSSCTVAQLSERLLAEIRAWTPEATTLQDDITLIAIDVLNVDVPSRQSTHIQTSGVLIPACSAGPLP
jgi:sigma-B regulation protein RsbU (phosphoserine phosphatase)